MNIEKKRRVINEFVAKCPICKKEMRAYTEDQMMYNIKVHIRAIHPEVDIKKMEL